MPVQNGMGQTGIPDVMAVINRVPFGFECKATPKQYPTINQAFQLERLHNAGGYAWVVDNESVDLAINAIKEMDFGLPATVSDVSLFEKNEKFSSLYRWRERLEPMEFGSGTGN